MRVALLLLAFSLPALAAPPCDTAEPKDVACVMSHDRNPEPASDIRYEWREAGLPANTYCGVRTPTAAYRAGRPAIPASGMWNPYQWDGRCFPTAGETRTYRVRACWVSTGMCSANWSAPIDVIGVAANEIRCCTPAGCGNC
jgi:hypothetical protein